MNDLTKLYRDIVIIFGAGILLVLVVFLGIIPWAEQLGEPAYLDVLVEEKGTKVEIAGQEYRNGVYTMEPGRYEVTVSGEAAPTQTLEVDLAQNQTTGLYLYLEGGEWRARSAEDLARREAIVGVMPIKFAVCVGEATRTNCDAIKVTYENARVVITGRKAELTDETLDKVKEELESRNYNLDDYRYIYLQNTEL